MNLETIFWKIGIFCWLSFILIFNVFFEHVDQVIYYLTKILFGIPQKKLVPYFQNLKLSWSVITGSYISRWYWKLSFIIYFWCFKKSTSNDIFYTGVGDGVRVMVTAIITMKKIKRIYLMMSLVYRITENKQKVRTHIKIIRRNGSHAFELVL